MVQNAAPRYAGHCRRSAGYLIDIKKSSRRGLFFSELVDWQDSYPLPADWYLLPIVSYASGTEILRFAQNDDTGGKGKP